MKKRKGFTLVELLIVIAIIAVLSTVGLIGYNSFKQKTYISNDSDLIYQMNYVLQGYEALDEKARNMSEAIEQCEDNGFVLENLDPQTDGYRFVYDQKNNRFSLMDEGFNVVYTDETKPLEIHEINTNNANDENLNVFVIVNNSDDLTLAADTWRTSVFLGINYNIENFIYNRGIDAGKNAIVKSVVYDNTNDNKLTHEYPVILRSSSGENLTINSNVIIESENETYSDTIYHYGSAGELIVKSNGHHSVHEFGGAVRMTAPLGAVEYKEGSIIETLIVEAVNNDVDVAITSGAQIGTLIIKANTNSNETRVDIQGGAFVREIIVEGATRGSAITSGNLELAVAEGAIIKASNVDDNNSNGSSATITGLPTNKDILPEHVEDTCANHNHDWASQPGLLVEFCKKCGTKRVTTVTSNTPTEEVTVTTTYDRESNNVDDIIAGANNDDINSNYKFAGETEVTVNKEKEEAKIVVKDENRNVISETTEPHNPSQPSHTHNWVWSKLAEDDPDYATHHKGTCSCGATTKEKHTLDNNGVCKCGYVSNTVINVYSENELKNAITSAKDNKEVTIRLMSDIDIYYTTTENFEVYTCFNIPSNRNIVLDFNGHYIRASKSANIKLDPRVCIFRIENGATISFVSSVEKKGLMQTDLAWEVIANNGYIPSIDNMEIKSTETTTSSSDKWPSLIWNYATGNIAYISNSNIGFDGTGSDEIDVLTNKGTIGIISDSKIYCHQEGSLTYKYAVTNTGTITKITNSILSIESDINSESHQQNFTLYNSGTIGELDSTTINGLITAISNGGKINKFSSSKNVVNGEVAGGGSFNIMDGTFSQEVKQSYLAPEYMCRESGSFYKIVKDKEAYDLLPKAASIGENKYLSFAEAYNAATSGSVIKLLADMDQQILINKSITVDLNGYNIIPTNATKSYAVRVNNGHVIITDSSANPGSIGTINEHDWWYTLMVGGLNSDLTIENISIYDGVVCGVYLIGGTNNAVVNFNSGTIYAQNSNTAGISIGATNGIFNMNNDAKIEVSSGKTAVNINIGDYGKTKPTFNMNGGHIIATDSGEGIVNQSVDYGYINLKNAIIETQSGVAINVGELALDNCIISSSAGNSLSIKHDGYDRNYNNCTVIIKNNTKITGSISLQQESKWKIEIYEGEYNKTGKNKTWFEKWTNPDLYNVEETETNGITITKK